MLDKMSKVVVANVQNFRMLEGDKVATVIASTVNVETASDYAEKIKKTFGGKLEIVPFSVRNVTASANIPAVSFHVRPVVESQPYTEEAVANMRTVVEANVFSDSDDATWEVVEAAGVKRLVKRTDTDVSALLSAAMRKNSGYTRIAASNYETAQAIINDGDFAIFTNPETASADTGIVIYGEDGGLNVLSRSSGNLIACGHDAVIASSAFKVEYEEGEEQVQVHETAALARSDVQRALDYFRKLYASQPQFFSQLESAIRKRFLLA